MARYCTAFEASVYYHDPHVQDERYTALSLEELFSSCDALCVCPELNDSTRGMIGRELIARLKPGASLVNSSRGEVLNQADLLAVLRERPDLRVGLDVLAGEVTNTHLESPLVELHRAGQIVITPHIAGASVESQSKAAGVALGLLKRHLEKP
jgi:phosphoglycerate dehydrogenase-like enzyme